MDLSSNTCGEDSKNGGWRVDDLIRARNHRTVFNSEQRFHFLKVTFSFKFASTLKILESP